VAVLPEKRHAATVALLASLIDMAPPKSAEFCVKWQPEMLPNDERSMAAAPPSCGLTTAPDARRLAAAAAALLSVKVEFSMVQLACWIQATAPPIATAEFLSKAHSV